MDLRGGGIGGCLLRQSLTHTLTLPSRTLLLLVFQQTSNFFAALDDSGDEGPAPVAIKKETKKQPAKKAVVEPSKPDQRYVSEPESLFG